MEQASAGTKGIQTGVTESAWSFRSTAKTAKICSWSTLDGTSCCTFHLTAQSLMVMRTTLISHIAKLTTLSQALLE